ncbi:MAG: CARDB domain-containing protein, partial [Terriglobales bacterium]
FSFGGPVPAITPADKTVNPGEAVTLDGSRSVDTLTGTTLTYNWTFCSLGFRPPQVGAALPLMNAPACNPAPGTVVGTDSLFSLTPPITPGQYYARLQINDNLGASAVIYSSVAVSQPSYDDPATRMVSLAQAYSSRLPDQVLAFFDATGYPAYTALGQALREVLPTYSSLRVNLQGMIVNANAGLATIQANWQLIYTIKNDPACQNNTSCQPPTYSATVGAVTTVWTLTPGKGWWITDLRPQPTLPGLPNTTSSLPDLQVTAVVRTGPQTFLATVLNTGTASSGPSTVHFVLTNPTTSARIGTADGSLGGVQVNGTGQAAATIDLSSLTQNVTAQITATVNPGCTLQESSCNNNTSTFGVDLVPLNVPLPDLKITGVTVAGQNTPPFVIGTGTQTFQATVSNAGPGALAATALVHFALTDTLGDTLTADGSLSALAAGASTQVSASIVIPSSIKQGTSGQLTVTVNPGCAVQESDCTNNSVSNLAVTLGSPPAITITSSRANTSSANPVELNGILPELVNLTATRPDNAAGSVTLTFTDQPQVANSPTQLTSIPYNTPEPADFFATLDAGGNVTTGATSVQVTPTNAVPAATSNPTTLFFNVGDILLSLPAGTICIPIGAGGQAPVPGFAINAVSGFNVPTVSWQWAGLSAGVSVNQVSGTASLSGTTYSLPSFTFTVANPVTQAAFFAVTITNSQGLATKAFSLSFDFSATPCGQAGGLFGVGHTSSGTWTRGAFGGGGMAKSTARPATTASMPDLQISAASITFSPSIPKPGDTVAVRFRVTNAGNADAQRVPITLVVNGTAVASDTFDVRAGASTLAALEWTNANPPSSRGPLQAAVVVDANHSMQQKSAFGKSAPLAHFAFLPGSVPQTGGLVTAAQRATLEVADGSCVGFRFASGAGSACGYADVEITAEQLASGRFSLSAQNGIADIGAAFGGRNLAGVQYQPEVPAVAGHSYAVQLRGGKTGILRLMAIRNPAQTSGKGRQVFSGSNAARSVGAQTTGPVETGDVSGVHTASQSKAYFDVSYQTQ